MNPKIERRLGERTPRDIFRRNCGRPMECRGPVVVATIETIEVIAERRVHARVNACVNIEHRTCVVVNMPVCLKGMPKKKM
jgi:hypothetical protein